MATTLMARGLENYIEEKLFLILRHGREHDCTSDTVKTAMKLVKTLKRRFARTAKQQPRYTRFYHKSQNVLNTLLTDLKIAYKFYKNGLPQEAYPFVQWARIRAYDIRINL